MLCIISEKSGPNARFQNTDDEEATAFEDHDMISNDLLEDEVQGDAVSVDGDREVEAVDDDVDNPFSLEDVDVEMSAEGYEDNLFNDDVSENMNLGLMED